MPVGPDSDSTDVLLLLVYILSVYKKGENNVLAFTSVAVIVYAV